MKLAVYSIYDKKAMTYGPTFEYGRDEEAIRFATTIANDSRNDVGRYPDDYTLYMLGAFDNGAGILHGIDAPKFVAHIKSLVKKEVKTEK